MANILVGVPPDEARRIIEAYMRYAILALVYSSDKADKEFNKDPARVLRMASELQKVLNPLGITGRTTVWRGILIDRPRPEYRVGSGFVARQDQISQSFSEDMNVACYFADPQGMGFGGKQNPKYGYVLKADVETPWVLFHHSYLTKTGLFKANMAADVFQRALEQKEVLVQNNPQLIQHVVGYYPGPCDTDEYRKLRAQWDTTW